MPAANPLVRDTGSPPIPEAQAWLKLYGGARGPAIDLSQAVPGYPAHEGMLERLAAAAGSAACAGYGPIMGDAPLREVYAAHLSDIYGSTVRPAETAITAGCNQAFVTVMIALAKAGDVVLLPAPWYFNHAMTLQMLGIEARPLPCRAEDGMLPDPVKAERLIDGRTKALVLVTPNNPTGAVCPPERIAALAEVCRRKGIRLVLDETYRDFLPDTGLPPHRLFNDPAWGEGVVSLYSFSKSYCIPGHRAGAITAGEGLMAEIAKLLDCIQICAPRPAQAALAWAIPALAEWRAANRDVILHRAAAFRRAFDRLPGWRIETLGAYFAYAAHPFPGRLSGEVVRDLATERGVLALPGPFFGPGQKGHLRIAFANAEEAALAMLPERLADFAI